MKLHLPFQEAMISSDQKKNLAFKVWRVESSKVYFAREKVSEFIEEIWEGMVQVVPAVDRNISIPFSECSSTSTRRVKCGEKSGKVIGWIRNSRRWKGWKPKRMRVRDLRAVY
jgi:hypothetical protein